MPELEAMLAELTGKGQYETVGERVFHTLKDKDHEKMQKRLASMVASLTEHLVSKDLLTTKELDMMLLRAQS